MYQGHNHEWNDPKYFTTHQNFLFHKDFEMKDVDIEGPEPFPVVITDEPTHKVWFHADQVFEDPECTINLHLFRFNFSQYKI